MAAEPIGTLAGQVIANLAAMIAEKQAQANAVAGKIGGHEHHKALGLEHEAIAEDAQQLAASQGGWEGVQRLGLLANDETSAWKRLKDSGFAT